MHASAQSGQLRVLCSNGIRSAVEQLTPEDEKAIRLVGETFKKAFAAGDLTG